ncbi:LicD family protein [Legionella shakespearei]|uniref:LicD family protein n=1 Tax=Legionella shakespearei DSM 23087 TaxID=1122169 RepID=A0A0W0YMH6_9GAMM|nr:LicD family protein [Legionella shakespearei]KTD57822.1 LicD family protein [Legionella shakespearei DSM 23087]
MGLEKFFQDTYPKIDGAGRSASYKLNRLIRDNETSRWRYVYGAAIPFSAGLSMATIFTTGLCGALDCLIQSAKEGKLVYGNMQTSIVYGSELWRSVQALFMGTYMALSYSPKEAAEKYLTIAADPHKARLNRDEAARVYAMGDGLKAFFIKHGIDHRMCSGTALGAFRDGGIILNDDDEDYLVHPDDVEKMEKLFEEGTFTAETGIQVRRKAVTGGWQCFYEDSPKKFFSDEAIKVNNPDAEPDIGDPFIDIFPAVRRTLGNKEIFTYGKLEMSAQSPGDYLTPKEWGTEPTIYPFGPTTVWGIERGAMLEYLKRCYGPTALEYKTLLLPHKSYADASVELRKSYQLARNWDYKGAFFELRNAYSTVTANPLPRFMRNETPVSTDFDNEVYNEKRNSICIK